MPEKMTLAELQEMLDKAAEAGAKRALHDLGLHDDLAGADMRELRGLLDAWRNAKKAAWSTLIKNVTTALLLALAAGVWIKTGIGPK
jgi:hypothetical protein